MFATPAGRARRACRSWNEGFSLSTPPVPSPLSPEWTPVPTHSPTRRFIPPGARPARACGALPPRPRRQQEQLAPASARTLRSAQAISSVSLATLR